MSTPPLEALTRALLRAGRHALSNTGGFTPISALCDGNLQVRVNEPDPENGLEKIWARLRRKANVEDAVAMGVVAHVEVTIPGKQKPSDALCVELHGEDADSLRVFMPYKKGLLGQYKFGTPFTGRAPRRWN